LIFAGLFSVAGFLVMRGAMNEWRRQVWYSLEFVPPLDQSERMIGIIYDDVEKYGPMVTVERGWTLVAQRSANMELLADVVRRTPAQVPFWQGATFMSLEGALVPRIFWPDKPRKTLGQDFGHRYAYLSETDRHTSMNLPVLVEFYINFGEAGVLLGMFAMGLVWCGVERIVNRAGQSYLVTAVGVPLLSQLCVIESDFSMQYGGLILECAAFALMLTMLESLSHRGRHAIHRQKVTQVLADSSYALLRANGGAAPTSSNPYSSLESRFVRGNDVTPCALGSLSHGRNIGPDAVARPSS
jgi:hypothetical protein